VPNSVGEETGLGKAMVKIRVRIRVFLLGKATLA